MNARERQQAKGKRFVELHARPGAFLIPNPWDAGTARILEHMGFKALTTTSAGLAYTLGKAHGSGQVTREETLTNAMAIVDATDLPVAADLENGYGDSPEVVAETIRIAGEEAGLVGGSIDDATGDPRRPTYEFAHTVESVAAAVEAARGLSFPFVVVRRAENFLRGRPHLDDTIRSLEAFEGVGANALYAPGLTKAEEIRAVCAAVGKPVNVVMGLKGGSFSVSELVEMGVRPSPIRDCAARNPDYCRQACYVPSSRALEFAQREAWRSGVGDPRCIGRQRRIDSCHERIRWSQADRLLRLREIPEEVLPVTQYNNSWIALPNECLRVCVNAIMVAYAQDCDIYPVPVR